MSSKIRGERLGIIGALEHCKIDFHYGESLTMF